jgi:hypothetical protein
MMHHDGTAAADESTAPPMTSPVIDDIVLATTSTWPPLTISNASMLSEKDAFSAAHQCNDNPRVDGCRDHLIPARPPTDIRSVRDIGDGWCD